MDTCVCMAESLCCSPEIITTFLINYACMLSHFSCFRLCVTLWTAAFQAPLSKGFSRQEYWSGLTFPSPGNLPNLGIAQDEALARDGVSREVPCSALKGETVPDRLPATPKSPPTRRVPPRGTPRVPAPLPLSPFSPPDRDRRGAQSLGS